MIARRSPTSRMMTEIGRVERIGDRRENLRAGLLLAALHLAQVAEGDARPARDLTEGHRLLQTEVTENVADFLTNQNHGVLLFSD